MLFFVSVFVVLILIYFFGADARRMFFAYVMHRFSQAKDAKYEELKKDLFKSVHSLSSHDAELKKNKELRILEIGVGTGVNFDYYPDGTNLVVIDPNPHFAKYYNENRSKFSNIKSEDIIVCAGEEMDAVKSNSVDAVVMTLVMCSVTDVKVLLQQIFRVLTPGGKFYFFEHTGEFSDDHAMRRMLQDFFSITHIWPIMFDGCYLNRDALSEIQSVGFSDVQHKRVHAPIKSWLFSIISPHLIGTATK